MSDHYLRRVDQSARQLFQQRKERLPPEEYTIETRWEGKHRTRIIVEVNGGATGHWVCDEPLTEIVDALNREFANDRYYAEIELEVDGDWANGFEENFERVGIGARLRVKWSDHG